MVVRIQIAFKTIRETAENWETESKEDHLTANQTQRTYNKLSSSMKIRK